MDRSKEFPNRLVRAFARWPERIQMAPRCNWAATESRGDEVFQESSPLIPFNSFLNFFAYFLFLRKESRWVWATPKKATYNLKVVSKSI
jgi:hypothetical protein